MKSKKFILKQMYNGFPTLDDFELVEEDVSEDLQDGEFLYATICHSVDPYYRLVEGTLYNVRDTIMGMALAKVTKSKSEKYKTENLLILECGWRNCGKAIESQVYFYNSDISTLVNKSDAVGLYGMTGFTAYTGLMYICNIKSGDTVFISGAAGATGNVAAQIAKLKGCRVVGSCGTDEKVAFCKKIGYDAVFNYKTESNSLNEAIKRVAPEGIDCYFDNVGGTFSSAIIQHMNDFGRVAACGSISAYNATGPVLAPILQPSIVLKQLKIQGFLTTTYQDKFEEIYNDMRTWANERKLKNYETITKGFENMPQAFIEMLKGKNIGKAVVMD